MVSFVFPIGWWLVNYLRPVRIMREQYVLIGPKGIFFIIGTEVKLLISSQSEIARFTKIVFGEFRAGYTISQNAKHIGVTARIN